MGIEIIYTCNNCGKTEKFGTSTTLRDLMKPGWHVEPQVGGVNVLCNECKARESSSSSEFQGTIEFVSRD